MTFCCCKVRICACTRCDFVAVKLFSLPQLVCNDKGKVVASNRRLPRQMCSLCSNKYFAATKCCHSNWASFELWWGSPKIKRPCVISVAFADSAPELGRNRWECTTLETHWRTLPSVGKTAVENEQHSLILVTSGSCPQTLSLSDPQYHVRSNFHRNLACRSSAPKPAPPFWANPDKMFPRSAVNELVREWTVFWTHGDGNGELILLAGFWR